VPERPHALSESLDEMTRAGWTARGQHADLCGVLRLLRVDGDRCRQHGTEAGEQRAAVHESGC